MKRFFLLILLTVCVLATCAQSREPVKRSYFVNFGQMRSWEYNLVNLGGGCIFSDRHSVGLTSSLITRNGHRRQLFDHGASADYNFYFRKADKYKFNVFANVAFDYFRRELEYYDDLFSSLLLENREIIESRYYNTLGLGFSFRLGRAVRLTTSFNYLFAKYQFTKTIVSDYSTGKQITDRVTEFKIRPTGQYSPIAFKMGLVVRLR